MSDDAIDSMDKPSMEAGRIVSNEWAMSMLPGGEEKEGDDGDVFQALLDHKATKLGGSATNDDDNDSDGGGGGASLASNRVITVEECLQNDDPLHSACQGGAPLEVIKYLVEEADGDKGKELLAKADKYGNYPLQYECLGGASLDVIKYLVEEADGDKGKELLVKADENGSYPLHYACRGGASLDVIKYLVEEADGDKGKELLGKANENGIYPLHYACRGGASLDVIKYLVEEADGDKGKELLGKADDDGIYPLHLACEKGASLDVIKYLVEEADADKGKELLVEADNNGRYPLHLACYGGASLEVIKYLVEEAAYVLVLFPTKLSSRLLSLVGLKRLNKGIKGTELLDKVDNNGSYPLHCACEGGASLEVIKYLVEEADGDKGKELLGKVDKNGRYPLHLACYGGASLDVIKYLVEEADADKGKELLVKADIIGRYPLHRACYGGASLDVIKYLVEEADGIKVKGKELLGKADEYGNSPLHLACDGGASLDVIKYLVEEADGDKGKELLDRADNNGMYPLHLACFSHAPLDAIKYLIQMNPSPLQYKDDRGLTALDYMNDTTLQATCGTHQIGSVADKPFFNVMEANCQSTIWNETDKVVYVILSDRTIETVKSTSLSTDMSPTIAGNTLASGSAGIADTKNDRGPTPPQITPILPRESRTFNLESTYYYVTCYTKNASDRNVFHEVNKRVKGTDNYKIEPHCLENCLFVAELENLFGKEIFLLSVPAPVSKMDTTTPPTADDVGQGGSSQRRTDPPAADDVGHCGSSQGGTDPGAVQGGERQGEGEDEDDDTSGNNNNWDRVSLFTKIDFRRNCQSTIWNKTDTVVYVIVSDRTIGTVKSTNLSAELSPKIAGNSLGKTGWSRTTQHNKGPTPPQMTTIPPFKSHTFNLENTYYYLTYYTRSSENGINFMDFHGMNLRWRGKEDYTIESTDVVHYVIRVKDDGMSLMTMLGLV